MSDFGFQVSPRLNQTGRVQYSVEDVYHITRGSFKEFNLKGYNPPKTAIPLSKEYKIPIDKDRDLYKDIKKKSADPNSTTYAYSNEKILTKYWHKPMGKFHTYRRHTFTEDAIKRSLKLPGPGAYLSTPKGKIEKKNFALGKFE